MMGIKQEFSKRNREIALHAMRFYTISEETLRTQEKKKICFIKIISGDISFVNAKFSTNAICFAKPGKCAAGIPTKKRLYFLEKYNRF